MAIAVFLVGTIVAWRMNSPLWWMLVISLVHFFLFCNVFRIVRRRELIWSGLFILNNAVWLWLDKLTWERVLMCQLPVTVFLVVADIRSPEYHGIFTNRLNPRLDGWLERRVS